MIALFVLRAQPFHKGHYRAIKYLMKKYNWVVVCLAVSVRNGNPFSLKERKSMIKKSLKGNYSLISVKDSKSDKKWVKDIEKKARFGAVVTGNPWTKKCFEKYSTKKAIKVTLFSPSKYDASKIRKLLCGALKRDALNVKQNREWESLVPRPVIKIINAHFKI